MTLQDRAEKILMDLWAEVIDIKLAVKRMRNLLNKVKGGGMRKEKCRECNGIGEYKTKIGLVGRCGRCGGLGVAKNKLGGGMKILWEMMLQSLVLVMIMIVVCIFLVFMITVCSYTQIWVLSKFFL